MQPIIACGTALLVLLTLAGAAQAQQPTTTMTFQLTVDGPSCPNATYWGLIGPPGAEFTTYQLTDPDGDGVYTGRVQVIAGTRSVAALVQGTGVQTTPAGPFPGAPYTMITDFGAIRVTRATTLQGRTSGCTVGLPAVGRRDLVPGGACASGLLLLLTGAALRRTGQHHVDRAAPTA